MRMIALAAVALALAACGDNNKSTAADDANAMDSANMMADDANMMLDSNAAMMNGTAMDANGSVNSTTANMMAKDAVTNDPDTNLANGM